MTRDLLDAATEYTSAGLSVLPIRADGSKAPDVPTWKPYMGHIADAATIAQWFSNGPKGIGVIGGTASGNLELLEFEGRAVEAGIHDEWTDLMHDNDMGDVLNRLQEGWVGGSPSGGVHYRFRVEGTPVLGNVALAEMPGPDPDKPKVGKVPLIETRGEGGYFVCEPSNGTVHPTGRPYVRTGNGPADIVTLTADEYVKLHDIARMFDRMPPEQPKQAAARPRDRNRPRNESPLDDFNDRTTWDEVIGPAGWKRSHTDREGVTYWTRPGKEAGVSASTGRNDGDNLYVFSSSTVFPTLQPLSRAHARAWIYHDGDLSAASRDLLADGYGKPLRSSGGTNPLKPFAELTLDDIKSAPFGLRLATDLRSTWLYVELAGWRRWDAGRWVVASEQDIQSAAFDWVTQQITLLMEARVHAGTIKAVASYLEVNRLKQLIEGATLDPQIRARLTDLDADPDLLNCPNGVVDLRTGELLPHDPALRMTKMAGCDYKPDATHPDWDAALGALPDDAVAWVQRQLGAALTGHTSNEDVTLLFTGSGSNGKTSFTAAINTSMGDYAVQPTRALLDANDRGHETKYMTLLGARLACIEELPEGHRLHVGALKAIVGSVSITARYLYKDLVTFRATHSLILTTNYDPQVSESDKGTWRRLTKVPFDKTYGGTGGLPVDPGLRGRLQQTDRLEAVLAWQVRGARLWYATRDDVVALPQSIVDATEAWRAETDLILAFLRSGEVERDEFGPGVERQHLYNAFDNYLRRNGNASWGQGTFTRRFGDHDEVKAWGISARRSGNARNWHGIKLTTQALPY